MLRAAGPVQVGQIGRLKITNGQPQLHERSRYGVEVTRYIIIGAGAVGGAIGGRLALAGRSVVLVARGDHLRALREVGLRLRTPDEDVVQQVPAVAEPDRAAPDR